jgi:gamma-tubulin complex component 5
MPSWAYDDPNLGQLPWPIMNIIQRSSIPIYQQIFTFLLQSYRTKYLVARVSLRSIQQIRDTQLRLLSYRLRQRLVWFADSLRSYLTETVIALSTDDMIVAMEKADDIDEMANIHMKYVARLQDQSLLSENLKPIYKAIVQFLDLGVSFSRVHFTNSVSIRALVPKPVPTLSNSSSTKLSKPSKSSRRKSVIPAIVEDESSDSDSGTVEGVEGRVSEAPAASSFEESLRAVETELDRLLPFITAGLRSVGRVGAEPVWEMLAERLGWAGKAESR